MPSARELARESYRRYARRHPKRAARTVTDLRAKVARDEREEGIIEGVEDVLGLVVTCSECGTLLEDEESRLRRMGSDCWRKKNALPSVTKP